jgi:hypothetical protein
MLVAYNFGNAIYYTSSRLIYQSIVQIRHFHKGKYFVVHILAENMPVGTLAEVVAHIPIV